MKMPLGPAELRFEERIDKISRHRGPTTLPPIQMMFIWSSSTPCRAEK
jgi:hypothetical protein